MKKKIVILLLVSWSLISFGQPVTPVSPSTPTPNAASLGLFGENPVSYFTGTPNIDVPIHTIKTPYAEVPISISYHAAGFRPDQHPSWVGMNWALNAGGVITRTVRGQPDEFNDGVSLAGSNFPNGTGYYFSHSYLDAPNWAALSSPYPMAYVGFYDSQPDEFSFNFLGYSGKFYMDHKGNWQVQSERPLKVSFNPVDFNYPFIMIGNGGYTHKTFTKFIITDDKGVQYAFGTTNAIEYSVGMSPPDWDLARAALATSWYLVSITPPVGIPVTFIYERGPYQSSLVYYQSAKTCTGGDMSGKSILSYGGLNINDVGQGISGTMLSPVYLTSISYPKDNLNISFNTSKSNELKYTLDNYYDLARNQSGNFPSGSPLLVSGFPGTDLTTNIPYFTRNPSEATRTNADFNTSKYIWLKLDNIQLSYSNGIMGPDNTALVRKTVRFTYTENSTSRLILNSATLSAADNTNPQTYSFKYENSVLPAYLQEITDHWGFSNGNSILKNGTAYAPISNLYNYRQPVAGAVLKGLITEVDYPTGGKTLFYFENHQSTITMSALKVIGTTVTMAAPLPTSGSGLVGGARVTKIENYDGLGNKTTKQYSYQGGVLENLPKYNWSYSGTGGSGPYLGYTENSAAILPASSVSFGRHMGYYNVTETNQDGSYKKYTFSNHDWGFYQDMLPAYVFQVVTDFQAIPVIPCGIREFERGKLLAEESYTSAGQLVAKKEFTYSRIGDDTNHYVRSVLIDKTLCSAGTAGNYPFSGLAAYYNLCYHFCNTNIKEHYYDVNNRELVKETVNSFDLNGYLTSQVTTASDGSSKETKYTYPYNYPGVSILDAMTAKNMISFPITVDKYTSNQLMESVKNNYGLFQAANFPALSNVQYKTGANPYELKFSYNQYDDYGNLLEMQKANDLPESYIWGYGSRWPIAKITGSTFATANALVSGSILNAPGTNAQLLTELNKLRAGLPNSMVTTFGYSIYGDLLSQTDPSGKSVSYEYDNIGRLQDIRDNAGNYIKKYSYNYQQQPFNKNIYYSDEVTQLVKRTDCGPCKVGTNVSYTAPRGKFSSTVSQDDTYQKALNDITTNASAYGIANGSVCVDAIPPGVFLPASNWTSFYSNIYPGTGNSISLGLVVIPTVNYTPTGWLSYIPIGTISAQCFTALPAAVRTVSATESGRTWSIRVNPSGLVELKLVSGTAPTTVYPINLTTSYNL